jgi:hypothetical protein
MKRLLVLSANLALGLLSVQPATAALPTPASGTTWAQNQRVEYHWKEGSEPPAWAKAAMSAAAGDSNSSRKAKAAIFAYDADAPSWLAYTDDLPTNWAIGYTTSNIPSNFAIRMRPHGTQLDWGTLRWCQFYEADAPNGCYDLEMTTLHEFGHALTLDHANEADLDSYTDTVMHATGLHSKARLGWNQHAFGRCDIARLQIRYEPLTASTPISTCLDMPTDLSLTPGSGSIAYGTAVTLTAKLKIAADAIYPLLASEPLSGRSILLQRRTPGLTTWTNVGELAAVTDDTGRYVKTLTLTATYEWRAVFYAPGDEGLDGATSNVSKLTVGYTCTPASGIIKNRPGYETC